MSYPAHTVAMTDTMIAKINIFNFSYCSTQWYFTTFTFPESSPNVSIFVICNAE